MNTLTTMQKASIARSKPRLGFGAYGTARAENCDCCRPCIHQSTMNASSTGNSSTRLTTAPRLKFCWPITCLKMSMASTLKLPPITFGMPKSLTVYENTTIAALTSP